MIKIIKADISDAEGIVEVVLKTWRTSYSGIVNEKYLSKREAEKKERIDRIKDTIAKGEVDGRRVFQCVAKFNEDIIGVARYGKCREEEKYDLENAGEIYAIYVLQQYQGYGIGTKLVNHAVKDLISESYETVAIWTLKDNPSINFYRKIGGDGRLRKNIEMGGQALEETGFVYDDINKLFENTNIQGLKQIDEIE